MRTTNKALMSVLAVLLFFGSAGGAGASLRLLGPSPQQARPSSPPPQQSASGRRITYSVSQQRVSLFEADGRPVRSYAVSGRRGFPPAGTYHVFSKSRVSSSGSLRLDYMVRFVPGKKATGFHAIPVRPDGTPIQSEAELGQYRSAGCVRQRPSDAAFLYDWAPIGTTVVVTG
ncbi:MAG: L,D-transpeptidase family protein [Actinomycetota bacterium]|nr:L,D-transpeptidase family protein [Actinomycetota bacterium]